MKTKVTVRRTTVREKILNLLRKVGKPLDAKTIAKRGKSNYNTVRKELGLLQNKEVVNAFDWFGYKEYKPIAYFLESRKAEMVAFLQGRGLTYSTSYIED